MTSEVAGARAMTTKYAKYGIKYRGYLLLCDPMVTNGGRFAARLTVTFNDTKDNRPRFLREFAALPEFLTEAEAVAYARGYGECWVSQQPDAPTLR